jgi:signal transduction histidine kinase
MEICLNTRDIKLRELCSDIFGQFINQNWTITICEGPQSLPRADLYIWDFESDITLPDTAEWRCGAKLFLVHRMDLALFRKRCPSPQLGILLKPVTRANLAAFIGHFTESHPNAEALRSDRDYLLQSLIDANLRLQEYDQDRSNFIARVVHDFRAPLTAISGYCGLFLADAFKPLQAEQRDIVTRMKRSADRLFVLADAMLDFTSAGYVERTVRLERGDMQTVISQALHEAGPAFSERDIDANVSFEEVPEPLFFDAGQMEQVVVNLLENASKFTPKGGSVQIRAYPYFWERRSDVVVVGYGRDRRRRHSSLPNSLRVDICDSGPGIPEGRRHLVFEEYITYSGVADRSGAGLGLAICKLIVQRHKGRIWVESTSNGCVFSFVIPFRNADTAERQTTDLATMAAG